MSNEFDRLDQVSLNLELQNHVQADVACAFVVANQPRSNGLGKVHVGRIDFLIVNSFFWFGRCEIAIDDQEYEMIKNYVDESIGAGRLQIETDAGNGTYLANILHLHVVDDILTFYVGQGSLISPFGPTPW
ncbi:MAG: hypothetical protein ABL921_17335 [Pirellula sp.]